MLVIEEPQRVSQLLARYAGRHRVREGVHISDLVLCLRRTYFKQKYQIAPTIEELLYWIVGQGYHELLEGTPLREVAMTEDGITGTVDSLTTDLGYVVPEEFKSTRQSAKRDVRENSWWIRQTAGYAKLFHVTEVRLTPLYIMGNWGKDTTPRLKPLRLVFTQEEIDTYWGWFKARRDLLLCCLEAGEPPQIEKEELPDWFCGACEQSGIKGGYCDVC